jgi:hypothetical protein
MKIPGYCEKCRRIRTVSVNSTGMISVARGGVATGVCTSCQQEEDDKRRDRGRRQR